MSNNNKCYHVKVLWLQYTISASIIINVFLIVSVRGFNEGLQPHNKLSWRDFCLALK